MKIETYLSAMRKSYLSAVLHTKQPIRSIRYRQYYAFRDHIANKYKELEFDLAYYKNSTRVFCELYMITSERLED